MFFSRRKDEYFDEEIKKMMDKAVEGITVSDELKQKIQKRINAEMNSCNNVERQKIADCDKEAHI